MEKVTITRVSQTDKRADGTVLENKFGKFYRIGIQTKEYGDEWLNGFSGNPVEWQEGDVVELEVSKEQFNGKDQLKFKLPNKTSELESRVKKLEEAVFGNQKQEKEDVINVDENADSEDEPF